MESRDYQRLKVSWHLNDLLKRDVATVHEVANWLDSQVNNKRDKDRRVVNRRMMARWIAAKQLLRAGEDIQVAREVMDRTEGKVADVVITGNLGDMVKALEAGRTRLLSLRAQPAVDGEVVEPSSPNQPQLPPVSEDPHKQ